MGKFAKKLFLSSFVLGGLLLTFQNCGPAFEGEAFSSIDSTSPDHLVSGDDLENEEERLLSLVKLECQVDSDCHAIGLGDKPCGGHQKALIYSSLDFPEEEFLTDVEIYNNDSREFNRQHQLESTCEFLIIPEKLTCNVGTCEANYD